MNTDDLHDHPSVMNARIKMDDSVHITLPDGTPEQLASLVNHVLAEGYVPVETRPRHDAVVLVCRPVDDAAERAREDTSPQLIVF